MKASSTAVAIFAASALLGLGPWSVSARRDDSVLVASTSASTESAIAVTGSSASRLDEGPSDLTNELATAANAAPAVLSCPLGQLPLLDVARFPISLSGGGVTPEAALIATIRPAKEIRSYPFGKHPSAPVWLTADGATYIASVLPDRTWFVSPATFVRCMAPTPKRIPTGPAPTGPFG